MATATKEDLVKTMKAAGIILMIFAVIGVIESIYGFINPTSLLPNTTVNGSQVDTSTLITIGLVICLIINFIELYFGYLGFKVKATKPVAVICLIVGILLAAGAGMTLTSGFTWSIVPSFLLGVTCICYHDVYRKLQKLNQ